MFDQKLLHLHKQEGVSLLMNTLRIGTCRLLHQHARAPAASSSVHKPCTLHKKPAFTWNAYFSGSEYLLRKALYRANLENSSESLTTLRPRATALLMSSSEESRAFICRASRTFPLNQASPDGCRRAVRINLLQRFLTKGCIPGALRRQLLVLLSAATEI